MVDEVRDALNAPRVELLKSNPDAFFTKDRRQPFGFNPEDRFDDMTTDLSQLVRDVAADHPHADPTEIAQHVAKLTPPESIRSFYETTLRSYVATILRNDRNDALSNAFNPPSEPTAPRSGHNRSPKRDGIKTWWATMLEQRVHVGTGHKPIGDCNVDDLKFCIAERQSHVADVQARIAQYEKLISLMSEHNAQTVRELPPQTELV